MIVLNQKLEVADKREEEGEQGVNVLIFLLKEAK